MSAIPSSLHYDIKPAAVPVYRRRCITNSTSSNPYLPGSTIKIPLDTAMHGSVLDPKQTMLQFTVRLINQNPFVDFVNLARGGWNSVIDKYRFMVNGNPVEKVEDYAEKYEDMLIKLGLNGDPYNFFHPNPFCPEEGPLHTNFIKPPMVDIMGNAMYRPHFLKDEASNSGITFGAILPHDIHQVQEVAKTHLVDKNSTSDALVYGTAFDRVYEYRPPGYGFDSSIGGSHAVPLGAFDVQLAVGNITTDAWNSATQRIVPLSNIMSMSVCNSERSQYVNGNVATDSIGRFMYAGHTEAVGVTQDLGHDADRADDEVANENDPANYQAIDNADAAAGRYIRSEEIRANQHPNAFAYQQEYYCDPGILAIQRNTEPDTAKTMIGNDTHTPAEWPYYLPKKRPTIPSYSNQRMQDISRYYSNCKRIPVGMVTNASLDHYLCNVAAFNADQSTATYLDLNVVTPLLSGLIGLTADKMFPDMLIAPGKAWIELVLQDSRKAFYVTMDPCRRVPGTIRDYVPYTGSAHGRHRIFATYAEFQAGINNYLGYQRALPILPAAIDRTLQVAATPLKTMHYDFNDAAFFIGRRAGVVTEFWRTMYSTCYNSEACKGTHFHDHSLGMQPYLDKTVPVGTHAGALANECLNDRTGAHFQSIGTSSMVPLPDLTHMYRTADSLQPLALPGIYASCMTAIRGRRSDLAGPFNNNASDYQKQFYQILRPNKTTIGGIPIPQYAPVKTPYLVKEGYAANFYVAEKDACYGTYLKQATDQSARTLQATLNNVPSPTPQYGSTRYVVLQVQLLTEQILLPDAVTSQILEGASQGAIQYHTTFIGSTAITAVSNATQNQLLTVTGASVNNLTLLFRSDAQLASDDTAPAYNSFAFYNPFAKVTYDPLMSNAAATKYDVGGKYTIENALTTKNSPSFQLQLKIGNEFIPRTPITDLPTLLLENEKGCQTIADYTAKIPYHCPLINTTSSNQHVSSLNYLDYAVLEPGFLSAFIPLKGMDDQTITGNPFFAVLDRDRQNTLGHKIAGTRAQVRNDAEHPVSGFNDLKDKEYYGTLNIFTPLEGTFHMCFNLDTFVLEGGSARCGTTIVNNQLFLQCQNMHMMTHRIDGSDVGVNILALWQQDAKIVFEAGGNCISYI